MMGFRGFTAPASLKEVARLRIWAHSRGFRGFTAPASLKVEEGWNSSVPMEVFPGLYRPGLIEGEWISLCLCGRRPVSGALPPRPH